MRRFKCHLSFGASQQLSDGISSGIRTLWHDNLAERIVCNPLLYHLAVIRRLTLSCLDNGKNAVFASNC